MTKAIYIEDAHIEKYAEALAKEADAYLATSERLLSRIAELEAVLRLLACECEEKCEVNWRVLTTDCPKGKATIVLNPETNN